MSQSHKAPGSETLRQRELHHYPALLVGRQLGIEESGLVEVLAHLYLFLSSGLLFLLRLHFLGGLIGGIGHLVSVLHHSCR